MRVLKKTDKKRSLRVVRHVRLRKKISGTADKPRLSIFKGSKIIFAQLVDDAAGKTLLGLASNSKEVKADMKGSNKETAVKLGKAIADKCKAKNISKVVFDRGGYKYHGVIKEFADSVRKNGIAF